MQYTDEHGNTIVLPVRYTVTRGAITATYWNGSERVRVVTGSAMTANGRDLEAFERALDQLRAQKAR